MFNFSSIMWVKKEDFDVEEIFTDVNIDILQEHAWVTIDDRFSTAFNIIQGASYSRSISYRLLKDYEEIDYIWTDLQGNIMSHEIQYQANKENHGEQILHYLDITEEMGTGEYIIIPYENNEYANDKERFWKTYTPTSTARTMIAFGNDLPNTDYLKNLEELNVTVDRQDDLNLLSNVQFGNDFKEYVVSPDTSINLKQLELPLYVDLSNKLSEAGDIGVIAAENQHEKIPIIAIGYLNGEPLADKFYAQIDVNQLNTLYPDWELNIDTGGKNILEIYIFCFPGQEIEELKPFQNFLYCATLSAKIYIETE